MLEKLVPTENSALSARSSWGARALSLVAMLMLGVAMACAPVVVDDASGAEEGENQLGVNLCAGQAANTFQCIDDTKFQHCLGNNGFVVNSCPAGLCATRTPSDRNPCIGRARAAEIDGVEPPLPGQVGAGAGNNDTGNNNNNAGNNNAGNNNNNNNNGGQCVGGPAFDPAGARNVGNGAGRQFIGGQCLNASDCASGCCALPCGICSGPGAQFQAGKQGCGFGDDFDDGTDEAPVSGGGNNVDNNTGNNDTGGQCVGGPAFDPAGARNVGNDAGRQFIGGQCLSSRDCASGCCALPCGICSGVGAQFQAGKQGCGFGD